MRNKISIITMTFIFLMLVIPAFMPAGIVVCLNSGLHAQTGGKEAADSAKKEDEQKKIKSLTMDAISDDASDSRKALAALKSITGDAQTHFAFWLHLLENAQLPQTKKDIIDHISAVHDKRIVVPLAKELSSPYHDVRKAAAVALKNNSDDRIYPYILALSTSQNPVYRIYFIEAMNYLFDRRFYELLTGMLKDPNKSVRIYVINCLSLNNLTESITLIRNIAMGDANDEVKINAIEAIGHFVDKGALYVLLKTLNEPNRDVRFASAKTLHRLAMANSAVPLSQRLADETEDDIKDKLLDTLIKIRNGGNMTGLSKILLNDASEALRVKSAFALGLIKDQRAIPILIQGIGDSSYKVRAETVNSLGLYKSNEIVKRLIDVVDKDPEIYVRSAALFSLKRINDRKSVTSLFDIYAREKDPVFRELLRTVIREFMNKYL